MTRKFHMTGITLVAALAAPSFASADHHRGRGDGSSRMIERMTMWDANEDGQVTQDEIDGFRAARLAEFDADKNGSLSLQEYEQLWLDAMRERMVDQFQRHDDDGDGAVTTAEFGEDFARIVERMDRNDDGVLSQEDNRGKRGERGDRGRRGGGNGNADNEGENGNGSDN